LTHEWMECLKSNSTDGVIVSLLKQMEQTFLDHSAQV